jgi:hypothetical protein
MPRRLALNIDQIRQYNPPPNFAKETDSRFAAYVRQYGTTESWELDSLDPTVIAGLVRAAIEGLIDRDAWNAAKVEEQHGRELLAAVSGNWASVEDFLRNGADQ